jgi:8-oxo-dGTP pyrophosphatase MutT (NUDIX family)
MTKIEAGVVDVLVVRQRKSGWSVLVLKRGEHTRCSGAWETVHGRIEAGESPPAAALRELREETGLVPERLYVVTAHPFYVPSIDTLEVAIVFCAFVARDAEVTHGDEHVRAKWLSRRDAAKRFAWPTEKLALERAWKLLRRGDAGAVDDALNCEKNSWQHAAGSTP